MADWEDLLAELDAWRTSGRCATFWWRDDDAEDATPELERMLALSEQTRTPLALAVIPRQATSTLKRRLARCRLAAVLQHGYAHRNHAPPGEKKSEFGPHRDRRTMVRDLGRGWQRISAFTGALPAFVPPWNRMDPGLVAALPDVGLAAVSMDGWRPAKEPAPGVTCANVHADIVDWRRDRRFVGERTALGMVVGHLRRRRSGRADPEEPTGILTHHRVHDEGCWAFLKAFLERTRAHPGARWLTAVEVLRP